MSRPVRRLLDTDARRTLLGLATLLAVIATSGSLYFSEGMGLYPCRLCWFQRVLMYPLVVILGVATLEFRPKVYRTALPLSLLGTGVAAYHSHLQIAGGDMCTSLCATVQYRTPTLGLTIPNLSLIAFIAISITLLVVLLKDMSDHRRAAVKVTLMQISPFLSIASGVFVAIALISFYDGQLFYALSTASLFAGVLLADVLVEMFKPESE